MVRRYRRRYRRSRPVKTVKYSNETSSAMFDVSTTQGQTNVTLIPAAEITGMRKAKNFELRIINNAQSAVGFALVYVPENTEIKNLTYGTSDASTSLYEPSQNVIMSGFLSYGSSYTNAQVFKTRLARNLNEGDTIALCVKPFSSLDGGDATQIAVTLNYAMTFN